MHLRHSILVVLLLLATVVGCKSEAEELRAAVLNYVQSEVLYEAPFRSYMYLSTEDQDHLTPEEYAEWSSRRDYAFGRDTELEIVSVDQQPTRAEVLVKLTSPSGDSAEHRYVAVESEGRWRVDMGLAHRQRITAAVEESKEFLAEGRADKAEETIDKIAAEPFRGSRPDEVEAKLTAVTRRIERQARQSRLTSRIEAAQALDAAKLAEELEAIEGELREGDDALRPAVEALRDVLEKRRREEALAALELRDVRVRRYRDYSWVVKEASFDVENTLERPLDSLQVRVEFLDEDGEAVAEKSYDVVDGEFAPGAKIEFRREIEDSPEGWDERNIRAEIVALSFADEDRGADGG